MLSENGDVITTRRQTTRPCGFNFAGRYIEMRMRQVHLGMRTEGIKAFGVVVWTGENGTTTISVDWLLFETEHKSSVFV